MTDQANQKESSDNYRKVVPEVQEVLKNNLALQFVGTLTELPPSAWSYGLTYSVSKQNAKEVFRRLRDEKDFNFSMLVDITAVDWMDKREPRFDVVYQLMSIEMRHRLSIKITVDEDKPEVESVCSVWPGANFLEREVFDMYGILFAGHGDLRRILLYDEFVGYPLRKDYPIRAKQPRVPLRVPELRNTSADMNREELVSLPVRQRLITTPK